MTRGLSVAESPYHTEKCMREEMTRGLSVIESPTTLDEEIIHWAAGWFRGALGIVCREKSTMKSV